MIRTLTVLVTALAVLAAMPAAAEQAEINIAQQYGVSFLPLMVMERDKLIEKHAKAQGLGEVKVNWVKVAGPSVMNDGLLSGTMHIVSQGAPSLITLWDKTRDGIGVKGISAVTTYPLYLVSRNPAVRTIKDFSEKYATLSAELLDKLDETRPGERPTDEELAWTWIERNDAQNYVVLGDPGVRLRAEVIY